MKSQNATDYRKLTWWKRTTAERLQIHLDAATPLILTPFSAQLFVRSDEHGWHRLSVTRLVNEQVPANYPVFDEGSVGHESFTASENLLVVRRVTGNLAQFINMALRAAGQFAFIGFVDQPSTLDAPLRIPMTFSASFPWFAVLAGTDKDSLALELGFTSVHAINDPAIQPTPIIKLPAKCSVSRKQSQALFPRLERADSPLPYSCRLMQQFGMILVPADALSTSV